MSNQVPSGYAAWREQQRRLERKPSYRVGRWLHRNLEGLEGLERMAELITASTAAYRTSLEEAKQRRISEIPEQVLAKADELGIGRFISLDDVTAHLRQSPAHQESPAGELEYFWHDLLLLADEPIHTDQSHRVTELFFGSLVVALHSLLGLALKDICRLVQELRRVNVDLGDFGKSKGEIERVRRYLGKVHSLEVQKNRWTVVERHALVRNIFAHEMGRIRSDDQRRQALAAQRGLALRDPGDDSATLEVVISADYVTGFASAIAELLKAISDAIGQWDAPRALPTREM